MSGVDRSDQMLSYYQGLRKSVHWYKKIGFHFLEIYLFNSFCLYNKVNPTSTKRLLNRSRNLIGGVPKDTIEKPIANFHYQKTILETEKKEYLTLRCRCAVKMV